MKAWQRGLLGAVAIYALAQVSGLNSNLDRWLTDAHWRWRAAGDVSPFPDDILVIGIDDASLQKLGRLKYWSRARYAELVDRLDQAAAVGLDILVVDPDEHDPAGDRALADAVARHGRTVVLCHQWSETRVATAETQAEVDRLISGWPTGANDRLPFVPAPRWQAPLPELVAVAAMVATSDVDADLDGVYRHPVILRATAGGRVAPHFSVAMACVAAGEPLSAVVADGGQALNLGGRRVELVDGRIWLRPVARRGGNLAEGLGRPVPSMSFADALTAEPGTFAGKLVLIGETATGTTDIRPNPLDPSLRGVELVAEMLANLKHLEPARPVPAVVSLGLLLLALLVPLWLYEALASARAAAVGSGVLLVVLLAVLEMAFWSRSLVPVWSMVLLPLPVAMLLMGAQRLIAEEQAKQQIRDSFSLYVAPELVDAIVDDPALAHQEGKRQTIAVLFSDIRGFTSFCEANTPERIVEQLRTYLGQMADSVQAHRGVLDKFIGDAVMALWGPFLDDDVNVAALAVACGLDMLDRLEQINEEWTALGYATFKIGIGIHLGEAVVGNIGSEQRLEFTALGDAVNLASRLESNTKDLGASFVVSAECKAAAEALLADRVGFRELGELTVRNRVQPVVVFEVTRRSTAAVGGEETGDGEAESAIQREQID